MCVIDNGYNFLGSLSTMRDVKPWRVIINIIGFKIYNKYYKSYSFLVFSFYTIAFSQKTKNGKVTGFKKWAKTER